MAKSSNPSLLESATPNKKDRAEFETPSGYPPPPGPSGIIGLGENREIIYRDQYFTGKILKTFGLRVPATSRYFPQPLSKS
jgi:hypothetical protein